MLICNNGFFYCFCDKYQECNLQWNQGCQLCPLCMIPVHFRGLEEELGQNQYDLFKLKQFVFKLYPFLTECYIVDKRSLGAYSGHYYYSSRDRYTRQKSEVLLKEMIEYREDLKKRNGEKNVLISFINF